MFYGIIRSTTEGFKFYLIKRFIKDKPEKQQGG